LITQTQVTLSHPRQGEDYKELLYSSLEELERMAKMIGDMLWLAKSDNQQLKLNIVPTNLQHEISELIDFFSPIAQEKHISIELDGNGITLPADRELLRRAVSNLLSNAIRYSPENSVINIRMAQGEQANFASISVSNTGKNIPVEHQARIFDRFYRAEAARERHSDGTGLGLAIVKSIIKQHCGKVSVTSKNNLTTFTIQLPSQG
jgi:two-component system heavy metal sensor histidine kinase CusS